jgi:hypothetical protein
MTVAAAAKNVLSRAVALHPFYVARPRLWSSHLWEIDARIALNLERKYCYVRIPRAANTAVTATLFYHHHGHLPGERFEGKRAFTRPSAMATFVPSSLEGFFCFTFVRNPYARVLSAYLSKMVAAAGRSPYRELGARVRGRHGEGILSFRAFCEYLGDAGPYGNPHWYPQVDFVDAVGMERLDFIGRVENMARDLAHVIHAIFGQAAEAPYREELPTGAGDRLDEHYDEASRALVREIYREDFERFGYEP